MDINTTTTNNNIINKKEGIHSHELRFFCCTTMIEQCLRINWCLVEPLSSIITSCLHVTAAILQLKSKGVGYIYLIPKKNTQRLVGSYLSLIIYIYCLCVCQIPSFLISLLVAFLDPLCRFNKRKKRKENCGQSSTEEKSFLGIGGLDVFN